MLAGWCLISGSVGILWFNVIQNSTTETQGHEKEIRESKTTSKTFNTEELSKQRELTGTPGSKAKANH